MHTKDYDAAFPIVSPSTLYDRNGLLTEIRGQFRLDWNGTHGSGHWARVLHHGMKVGTARKADLLVVELFAFLHDSQRQDEYGDWEHGARGSEYARALNGTFFDLKPKQIDLLCKAIAKHSDGEVVRNVTIQSCWDADRLDLGRVGIEPSAEYRSQEAVQYIEFALEWSQK